MQKNSTGRIILPVLFLLYCGNCEQSPFDFDLFDPAQQKVLERPTEGLFYVAASTCSKYLFLCGAKILPCFPFSSSRREETWILRRSPFCTVLHMNSHCSWHSDRCLVLCDSRRLSCISHCQRAPVSSHSGIGLSLSGLYGMLSVRNWFSDISLVYSLC